MNVLPEYVEIIEGQKPGPSVVVMGAVHGNERVGAAVIEALRKSLKADSVHGTLTLILGNPAAYEADKRCVDVDLNRQFGPEIDSPDGNSQAWNTSEGRRATELAPHLRAADFLLDIHATGKPSDPFVYCESTPAHAKLAKLFGVKYVVSPVQGDPTVPRSAADNYVDRHEGVGITYEAGWIHGPNPIEEVLKRTYTFLRAVGCLAADGEEEQDEGEAPPQHVEIYSIVTATPGFTFTREFSNFDPLKIGEVFARDGQTEFHVEEDSVMIFPKVDIVPGKPAGYLARVKTR